MRDLGGARMLLGIVFCLILSQGVVAAGDCQPVINATLANWDDNAHSGRSTTLRTYKFRVEISVRESGCHAVNFALLLNVRTSDGESQVVRKQRHMKVHGGQTISMLVEHQMTLENTLDTWELEKLDCHMCQAGD